MEFLMLAAWSLLSILFNFYVVASVMILSHCFLDHNIVWNRQKKWMLFGLSIFDEIIGSLWDHQLIAVLIIILNLFVFAYGCERKLISVGKIFVVLCYLLSCFLILCDIGGYYVLQEYSLLSIHEHYYSMVGVLLFTPLYYYLKIRFLDKDVFIPFRRREKWFFAFYGFYLFSFFAFLLLMEEDRSMIQKVLQTALVFTMLLFSIGFPAYLFQNRIHSYDRDRQDYQEALMQTELAYFQQYKEKQKETRRFRHDIRNHLLCLQMLLEEHKENEAAEYLDSLLSHVRLLSADVVTGDEMLDGIFSAKCSLMKQNGITFSVDGVLDHSLPWKPIDLCSVFANALDNAIEACQKISVGQRREIQVSIKMAEQFYCIEVKNTVSENVDCMKLLDSEHSMTTKQHREFHGIGVQNIKRTMEKYGGMLQIDCEDGVFTLSLLIPRSFTTQR